jgi:tRNA 2-thiocytidine biosynthesis protein TtcA
MQSKLQVSENSTSSVPIAAPPWTQQGKLIESKCRKAIYEYALLDNVPKVMVALSGGKDSLTLLYMLAAIRGRGVPNFELAACLVAGEFSCGAGLGDHFLPAIAEKLGIPFFIKHSKKKTPDECYSCSRERRKLLFEAAHEWGCRVVAFGHHRDDSVQTLLMNLLHKGEFAGNLPKVEMVDYGIDIIRPLIYVDEEEIRRFAKHYGFLRMTCQCPRGQNSLRKQTDDLLRIMEEYYPNCRVNLSYAIHQYGSNKAAKP